ncbi:hypothetical protein BMS3Abin17_00939 [archaeon BMS3Abin17]|nr:hypothetical protein BMS3Abin17_00939 [archaeon BMS3Abin17]HDZ60504.1 hypothetical protein [Candidatus Pacearchaeota archaeon]
MEGLSNMSLESKSDLYREFSKRLSEKGKIKIKKPFFDNWKLFMTGFYPKIIIPSTNNLSYDTRDRMLCTVDRYLKENNFHLTEVDFSRGGFCKRPSIRGVLHSIEPYPSK